METKRCVKCEEIKEFSDFYKIRLSSDGHDSYCRDCRKAANKKYYQQHRAEAIMKAREYRRVRRSVR